MKEYGLYESASVKVPKVLFTPFCLIPTFSADSNIQNGHRGSYFISPLCSIILLMCAMQAARMLLRVDDVVQAIRKDKEGGGASGPPPEEMAE